MNSNPATIRTRWAAIGAAIAVTVGAAGIAGLDMVNAEVAEGDRPVYVPIDPCRLADTRSGANNVGPRATPLTADETVVVTAHGSNGECTGASAIPQDAVALALNVTALNATSQTFLTFWGDGTNPGTANLNPAPGQPPTPNAVNTPLSASGTFSVYNERGTVNAVIDVNGYYAHHNHDDRYEAIPDQVLLAPADFQPWSEDMDFARSDTLSLETGSGCFYAPVHLPDGVTIESVTAIVSVENANDSARVRLNRTLYADGTGSAAAIVGNIANELVQITTNNTLTHVTDSTIGQLVNPTPADAVVDNATYMYNAHICVTAGHRIYGYIIDLA